MKIGGGIPFAHVATTHCGWLKLFSYYNTKYSVYLNQGDTPFKNNIKKIKIKNHNVVLHKTPLFNSPYAWFCLWNIY